MPDNGEQQPSGPPEYKVYRSRRSLLSRLRPLTSRACESGEAILRAPDRAERAPTRAPGKPRRRWTPSACSNGSRWRRWAGFCSASSPSPSPPSCRPSSSPAKRSRRCTATRSCCPSAQTILVLGTDARPTEHQRSRALGGARCTQPEVLRTAVARRRPPRRLLSRRIPGRHPDADPGRGRCLPQTLDPARQLRRNPRPGNAENQRRLRLGGAALEIKTIEQFLGIKIDHVWRSSISPALKS